MLLRFEGYDLDQRTQCGVGIFQIAYRLVRGDAEDYVQSELRTCLDWFEQHLFGPDRIYRPGKSRYAISWFRSTATTYIAVARRMVAAVDQADVLVGCRRTLEPGYIVYEDRDQVVAIPFTRSL
jgi:hypothetical protein